MEYISIKDKELAIFDLDGTLTESKQPMDEEVGELLRELLELRYVAIISGGRYEQFLKQLPALKCPEELLKKLYFFPTSGTRFYRYKDEWTEIYAHELTEDERKKIKDAFAKAYKDVGYGDPEIVYGEVIEDRGTQITFSALGQEAPLDLKKQWRATQDRRPELIDALEKYLPDFEIKMPGVTSIDVTRKGIDKGYGVEQMKKNLNIEIDKMIFVGDALYEGGNDQPALKTGVDAIPVTGPTQVKGLIRRWLAELSEKE